MWHPSRFAWFGRRRASPVAVHHPCVHPSLESLEDRTVPTLTISPTNLFTMVGSTPPPLEAFGAPNVLSTFAGGLNFNQQMVFDHSGNLFVANQSGNDIIEITPQGKQSVFASGFNEPKGVAFDSQGNLYVGNQAGNSISKVTPAGAVSTFVASINQPGGLAFDQSGNLYVANEGAGDIRKVTPAGVVTIFAYSGYYPNGLAFDQNGDLYVSNEGDQNILKISPSGVVSLFMLSGAGLGDVAGMAFDSHGNLYVASYYTGKVSEISPTGAITTLFSGMQGVTDVQLDAADNLYISQGWDNSVLKYGPAPVTFSVASADAAKLSALGLTLNPDGSFSGQVTSVLATPLTFTAYASDSAGDSGSAAIMLTVESKWALISVTPSPSVLQASSSPQQISLNGSAQDSSTGQPVTEGKIQFTIYEGTGSNSQVIGRTDTIPVDSQGNVTASFTIPANTPPGTYLIVAHYADQGGNYSNSDGSIDLTIQPAPPVPPPPTPPPSPPLVVPPSTLPATPPTKPLTVAPSPTPTGGATAPFALLGSTGLTSVFLPTAGTITNNTGTGASSNPYTAPSSPFAIAAYIAAAAPNPFTPQILTGQAIPVFLLPVFSQPAASPPIESVVLDVPAVPFLPLGFGSPKSPSLAMGAGSQAESEMPSLSEVTTTALRLGTSLSDADDSAELFYNLAHKGIEASPAASNRRIEIPSDGQIGSTSEAAAQPVSAGDAGE